MQQEGPEVLVLGAGGIVGEAWMAGVLAGLGHGSGWDPRECRHFVGTSAGSIVAAGLAAGIDPASRLDDLPTQPASPDDQPTSRSLLGGALRFGRGAGATAFAPLASLALRSTAVGGAAVRRAALGRVPEGRRSLSDLRAWVASLKLDWDGRLRVVAVELESGRRVAFGEAGQTTLPVADAVTASCAIPGVFRPLRANGQTYVDGGAWSLTNLDVAPVAKGTHVLCLNPTGSLGALPSLRGAVGPLSRSAAGVESLALQRSGALVTTLAPDADSAQAMGSDFMDGGRRAATARAGFAQGVRAAASLGAAA